jgi:G3E family GTPase
LRRLLASQHGQRISVVMNELGQAGIDGAAEASSFVELTEGCVCCTRNPDLIDALETEHRRGGVDRVIVETTGLADPMPLTWTLARPDLAHAARLDAVIAVVDAVNAPATRTSEWDAQVRSADLIVLSKLDLATPAQLTAARDAVLAVNGHARLLDTSGALPLDVLLDADVSAIHGARADAPVAGRHSEFGVVSLGGRVVYAAGPLEDLLETLPGAVFRAKGIVRLDDGRWAGFHSVGGRLEMELDAAAPSHGESRIVMFGRSLDRDRLAALFAACAV